MLARAAIPSHMMHDLAVFRRRTALSLAVAASVGLAACVGLPGCARKARQGQPPETSAPAQIAVGEPHPATPTTPTTPTPAEPKQPETGQAGQAAVDLAPKLAAGLVARYSVRAEGQEATELTGSMAARSETKWDATLDVLVQVRDATPGSGATWTATISLDRVRATDLLDGRAIGFDSAEPIEKDPANLVRPTIEGLVGKRIELDLDVHGQIVNARIPAELAKRYNPTTRWTTRLLGDADLRTLFGPVFSTGVANGQAAEGDRASVGQTWTTTCQELFGSANVTTTVAHALAGTSDGSATISLNGTAAITPNEKVPAGMQRITRDAYSGTTRWDLSRGLLAEHELGRETQVQVRPEPEGFTILKTLLVQVRRMD